jgi:SAM-dependent methyltransferase
MQVGYLDCTACGTMYPILAGVPVMFSDAVVVTVPKLDEPTARAVLRAYQLPVDPVALLRVRYASGYRVRLNSVVLEAEALRFVERVRASGHDLPACVPPSVPESPVVVTDDVPRYRWLKDYVPRRLRPGQELTANIRFENSGPVIMRHAGTRRITLTYQWLDGADNRIPHEDERTPLPTDVPPGGQLTAPIRLTVPSVSGRHRLKLLMIEEGRRWLESDEKILPIHVTATAEEAMLDRWTLNEQSPESYQADHARAATMLADWLERHVPARPRVLEIGGNSYPMISGMPGELYNVDVDLLGLQVGRMVQRARGGDVTAICADVGNLPFPRYYFDAIVVVASLHHFPDPAAALREMRERLAPGGSIFLLCEPVGHIWPGAVDAAFLTELKDGINEQSFSAAEYAMIFRDAGLSTQEAIVDSNSLKARLINPMMVA